jgi:hypothetical protein
LAEHCKFIFYYCVCVRCKLEQDGMGGERHLEATMVGQEMQVSFKDGIGGGDLEARVVGKEMQISAEDVIALVAPKVFRNACK